MSELTPCCFCSLQSMRRRAAKRGVDVVTEVVPDGQELAGWTAVRFTDRDKASTWFLVLTDKCAC